MTILALSKNGQIVLPKDLMVHMGLPNGGKVRIEKMPDGSLLLTAFDKSLKKTGAQNDKP